MSRVVEHLAELTGFRDRDVLDVTLVGALKDLLAPESVAIYRSVEDGEQQRWLTRARLGPGDTTPTADPLWTELSTLPLVQAHPERLACLKTEQTQHLAGPPATTFFAISSEREALGVVEVQTAQPLSAEQLRLVGSILRIYRNVHGLLDYGERDTLTGLLNRKTFEETVLRTSALDYAQAIATGTEDDRRQAFEGGAWLAVIDIDHFKRVNDGFGHLIGDEVLLLLSRLMRSSFRFHDHLYRFGGEEFVVLMRCANAEDAAAALQRLRLQVQAYAFPQVGQITVSIGFTSLRPGDTPAAAFDRADKAVYWAKQHGRNQVAHHAELVAGRQLADESRDSDVEFF